MSDEVKKPEPQDPAKDDEKKNAEAEGMYHLYCPKCGHTWWSPSWDNYCPKWGCTGQARRM